MRKRGLGRDLNALLGGNAKKLVNTDSSETSGEPSKDGDLRILPVDVLQRGRYQPRHEIEPEALQELANSIKAQGVVQPIVVRPISEPGKYEIIAGERRWRACQLAGLHEIPTVIRDVPDQTAMAMALIENIQREDLNPIDESMALQRLIDEFGLTQQETGDAVGRSRSAVANLLRLLSLNTEVKSMLEKGELEMGHARALLAIEGGKQTLIAREVVKKGLSVRETEQLVRKENQVSSDKTQTVAATEQDPNVKQLQSDLSEKLGAKVQIEYNAKGKGKLVVQYNSFDELDGIIEHIK
ncbi:Chromosome (plasmid) partitioning protein ParB [hydrothermal vent metagenome]|uniref:Chromosome (Plasmid) partitioning protein ParB n=1 Tax=hydrothermal vent metagenome TaxID=652676 RepID=A0A3B1A414_9ZZZZ